MTTTAPPPAIEATALRKSFGDTIALDGIDLDVAAGTIFALEEVRSELVAAS